MKSKIYMNSEKSMLQVLNTKDFSIDALK